MSPKSAAVSLALRCCSSEKVAAAAVPVIGALGGAAIDVAFVSHFQNVARGHFIIRRLERRYGKEAVRALNLQAGAVGPPRNALLGRS